MSKTDQKTKTSILILSILGVIYFMIGFGVGIAGILIPFLQNAFELSNTQSYLVTTAIFSAFVIFGAPSGLIIKNIGYRKSMVLAFLIMSVGMILFIPSANLQSFPFFLMALFVGGMGNTLLQAAVNPFVSIIGPHESAAMRLSLMGIMNKAAWWLGPLFLGLFLDINNAILNDLVVPFVVVSLILAVLGLFVWFMPLPEVVAQGEEATADVKDQASQKQSIWQFPHLLLGAVAIFIYVGVETLPMASAIDFTRSVYPLQIEKSVIEKFTTLVPIGLVIGYLFGVLLIPKFLSQTTALRLFASLGIVSTLLIWALPPQLAIYMLAALGFSNSLMWPAIWPLAIADLGKFTKAGSSLLVMGIVGGAIIPLLFGWVLDSIGSTQLPANKYQIAYLIMIPGYLYILYYAINGYKKR